MENMMSKNLGKSNNPHSMVMLGVIFALIVIAIIAIEVIFFPKNNPAGLSNPAATNFTQNNSSNNSSPASNNSNDTTVPSSNQLQSTANLTQNYQNSTVGYSIKYPNGWIYDASSDGNIAFSGPENTPSYDSLVTIEKISGTNLDAEVASLKNDYTSDQTANAKVSAENPFSYVMSDGTQLQGKAFTVDYMDGTDSIRDLAIVVPQGSDVYLFSYSSPTNQYSADYNNALAMLNSWMINK